jgi:Tol biopolymer transport system component
MTMSRRTCLGLLAGFVVLSAITALPANAKVHGPNGRIAFARSDPALGAATTYTVNPDGSHLLQLFPYSEGPYWSPDGSEVEISTPCLDGMENCGLTIVGPDSGSFRQFKWPDPTLETPCGHWTPDGKRVACESFGVTDPSRNGIYTIRSSDGGGLTRITTNPGGDDNPGDFSPDGKRLVFVRSRDDVAVGIFVVKVDGTGLRRITPAGMVAEREQDPIRGPLR